MPIINVRPKDFVMKYYNWEAIWNIPTW